MFHSTSFAFRFSKIEKMVESNVCNLLDGLSIEDNDELCDFTLADQNEVVGKWILHFGHASVRERYDNGLIIC